MALWSRIAGLAMTGYVAGGLAAAVGVVVSRIYVCRIESLGESVSGKTVVVQ